MHRLLATHMRTPGTDKTASTARGRKVVPAAVVAVMAVLIAGTAPALALDCQDGFRPFTHYLGETCIPQNPQRIVTLQDQNALLPLMELGVRPIGSAGHVNGTGERIFRRMEGYDTSGIEWIGTYREPDPEAVAALEPDLIVAAPLQAEIFEIYSKIAPTISIDMFDQPLEEVLFQFADAVNRTERANELQVALAAKAGEVRERLGDRLEHTTVSIIEREYQGSGFHRAAPAQSVGAIRRALALTMSPPESDWDQGLNNKSLELIGEHVADVMFFLAYDADQGGGSQQFDDFAGEAVIHALPVVQAGQLFVLDGSAMVGSAWSKIGNGLDQIAEVLLRDDLNRDIVQE